MPTIEEMSLDEIETTMAHLRERRRSLKKNGKAAERKIATLLRRRERALEHVREIDTQIEQLRREAGAEQPQTTRRRGRPKAALITVN